MRQFTEEEKQWLIEHYQTSKQKDCARHLHCSDGVIRRVAKELGIYEYRKTYDNTKANKEKKAVTKESNQGYCMDCALYKEGGICGKNGKVIGALQKKNCFKERGYE